MFVVGVYVTSRYKNYPELKVTLDEALKKYIPIGKPNALCTGSSKSNNSGNGLVRKYAFEHGIPCRVFETQWSNNIPTKPGKKNTAGVRANAMIIRNSNACVLFWTPTAIAKWDFMSGGCYNFRKMCGKMGRELIEVKVDIYKPVEDEVDIEKSATLPDNSNVDATHGEDDTNIAIGMRNDASMPMMDIGGGQGGYAASSAVGGVVSNIPQGGDENTSDVGITNSSNILTPNSSMPPPNSSPNTDSGISNIPVDVDGDGTVDTTISAMDTDKDGVADSQLVPVDVDNNGTVDKIELAPLPQNVQQPNQTQQTTSASQDIQQVTTPNAQNVANVVTSQNTDEENNQQQQ